MDYQIQALRSKHLKIMDMVLEGKSNVDIAEELGLSQVGVRLIVNAPVFQSRLSRERSAHGETKQEAAAIRDLTAKQLVAVAAVEAARTQIGLLKSGNERIAQISAMDILDRAGVPKISREDHRSLSATIVLTDEALERMKQVTEEVFSTPLDIPLLSDITDTVHSDDTPPEDEKPINVSPEEVSVALEFNKEHSKEN